MGGASRGAKGNNVPGGRLWPARLGMCSLRVYMGVVFLAIAHFHLFAPDGGITENIVHFAEVEYMDMVVRGTQTAPAFFGVELSWYPRFLETVMLGGNAPYVFGGSILVFQGLLGICLVLGVGVRLMGFLGGFQMLAFMWAKAPDLPFYTTRQPNYLVMMVLFALALTAAGRIWGLDARLRRKLPRWLAWVS